MKEMNTGNVNYFSENILSYQYTNKTMKPVLFLSKYHS